MTNSPPAATHVKGCARSNNKWMPFDTSNVWGGPWYKRLDLWLGILGVLVAVSIPLYIAFSASQEQRHLTLGYQGPVPWLTLEGNQGSNEDLGIIFGGSPVDTLGRLVISIQNTGTGGITSDMFPGGPLNFEIIGTGNNSTEEPLLLRIVDVSPRPQRAAELTIIGRNNPSSFTYKPGLINEGNSVHLEVLLSTITDVVVKANGVIVDGDILFVGKQAPPDEGISVGDSLGQLVDNAGGRAALGIIFGVLTLLALVGLEVWPETSIPPRPAFS
jgi:hypothetical protein